MSAIWLDCHNPTTTKLNNACMTMSTGWYCFVISDIGPLICQNGVLHQLFQGLGNRRQRQQSYGEPLLSSSIVSIVSGFV